MQKTISISLYYISINNISYEDKSAQMAPVHLGLTSAVAMATNQRSSSATCTR